MANVRIPKFRVQLTELTMERRDGWRYSAEAQANCQMDSNNYCNITGCISATDRHHQQQGMGKLHDTITIKNPNGACYHTINKTKTK